LYSPSVETVSLGFTASITYTSPLVNKRDALINCCAVTAKPARRLLAEQVSVFPVSASTATFGHELLKATPFIGTISAVNFGGALQYLVPEPSLHW